MLTSWQIKNFKSFKEPPQVDFSTVNVLAGANSSGKSTLIQSILLLKQTIQYGSQDREITLNGPLLRLGSFSDIRNNSSSNSNFTVAFDMKVLRGGGPNQLRPDWARSAGYSLYSGNSVTWERISLFLDYADLTEDTFPRLDIAETRKPPSLTRLNLEIQGSLDDQKEINTWEFTLNPEGRWPYHANLDPTSQKEVIDGRPDGRVNGGLISHFLPEIAVVDYNATELAVNNIVETIFEPSFLGRRASNDETLSPEVVSLINDWLTKHDPAAELLAGGPVLASQANQRFSRIARPQFMTGILGSNRVRSAATAEAAADLEQLKANVKATLLSERKPERAVAAGRSTGLNYAVSYISDFFRFGVRYLGPLREGPRPVYQPEALEGLTDVGYKGEHTAAVFELNKHNRVQYIKPPKEGTDDYYVATAVQASDSLENAAAEWLVYLGVAASVQTIDSGVFGNRMQVSIEKGAEPHDLTNVGVGVSQVLPILVTALLAPRGSLLIFEQPELHLHPKVQARLADFFLALGIDGKQTLLETHSEYLVDRLRFRIATSEEDNIRPLVKILFSEKHDGCSALTPVEISEFGAILNWPADFFEQSQKEISRIVQAAARKRKNRTHKG
ncbi:AAA family ATPase [Rhizobium jaguaris]|uniref:DUF3696 domain-containing protein n=1 Tax=Rhizobium jaguaris TaxID=1312183 RepID=A0A387FVW2_9HYPH|nr:DUF3696 domain-containing protein [Rhizobium jaguaris]AYG60011.1 DUF3696 domain-containing protein [Rhizobium jaguaris]